MKLRTLSLLFVCSLGSMAIAQVRYRIEELAPPTGYVGANGYAINDRGVAVGLSDSASGNFGYMATIWRGGRATVLGKVPKGNYSEAEAINNAGRIAGEGDDGSFRPQACIFENGEARFIDTGSNNARGIFVAESGFIVGNYLKGFGDSNWFPTIWTEDPSKPGQFKRFFLPRWVDPNGGFSSSYALGANNMGQVVGQLSSSTLWSSRGGFWNNDAAHSLSLLDPLPGEWDSYAYGINDAGWVCGLSDVGVFSSTPVVWSPGPTHAPTALPLFAGESSGMARAINSSGQVIGTHGDNNLPATWVDGQIYDLQACLDRSGTGWTLQAVYAINSSGQIVGTGIHNGQSRGFVLTKLTALPRP